MILCSAPEFGTLAYFRWCLDSCIFFKVNYATVHK